MEYMRRYKEHGQMTPIRYISWPSTLEAVKISFVQKKIKTIAMVIKIKCYIIWNMDGWPPLYPYLLVQYPPMKWALANAQLSSTILYDIITIENNIAANYF